LYVALMHPTNTTNARARAGRRGGRIALARREPSPA